MRDLTHRTTYEERERFRIPFLDLVAQFRTIEGQVREAIDRILERQWFVLGEELAALEAAFSRHLGGRVCVACGSGSDAIYLALKALGVGQGDGVVVPAFTFAATAVAVRRAGAVPVFADVDSGTRTLSPETVLAAMTPQVRAVLAVHLYGYPAPIADIREALRLRSVWVIEDACQAHGARRGGAVVGAMGDAAAFSFYPGKNLGGWSDGGLVAFADPEAAARARRIADYGLQGGECVLPDGINSHLSEINAAVLRIKLEYLERWNVARREHAHRYSDLLGPHVRVPAEDPDAEPVYHTYVVEVPDRGRVQRALVEDGIQARVHYPRPLHRHSLLRSHARPDQTFPVSEQLAETVLSLPIYPEMSFDDVGLVAGALLRALGSSPHARAGETPRP
jgi:dTDP-4-amino-4,6-dideoxygalactose transaminase